MVWRCLRKVDKERQVLPEKTLRNAKVTSAELYTLVVKIEGTLNNRP